ncbi:MAG: DUF4157 domain-containing protein, partial [Myxococcota bacterium]
MAPQVYLMSQRSTFTNQPDHHLYGLDDESVAERRVAPGKRSRAHDHYRGFASSATQPAVQRKASGNAPAAAGQVALPEGAGEPLPAELLAMLEGLLGVPLGDVRMVRDSAIAQALGALAFTAGNIIYFSPNTFDPDSPSGFTLLVHELVHVLQQRALQIVADATAAGLPVNTDASLEAEADQVAAKATDRRFKRGAIGAVAALSSLAGGPLQPAGGAGDMGLISSASSAGSSAAPVVQAFSTGLATAPPAASSGPAPVAPDAPGHDLVEVNYLVNGVRQQRLLLDRTALHHRVSAELMQLFRSSSSLDIHSAEHYDNLRGDQLMGTLGSFHEVIVSQEQFAQPSTQPASGGSGSASDAAAAESRDT